VKIRVLIADDHPLVRDGLRFSIERSGGDIEIVAEAADGFSAVKAAKEHSPDVFVLDITMPRMNGLETAREILRGDPAAKIIILSLHDTRAFVEDALELGARGYLTKDTASRHIIEALKEVQAGRFYLSPQIAHILVEKGIRRTKARRSGRRAAALTGQERKILQLIAEGRTGKEIAAALEIAPNTVHAHRTNLMTKLGLHKQTDLVRLAIKEGWVKL
jgi:DNA-binding NarL/FixJ family response regulator